MIGWGLAPQASGCFDNGMEYLRYGHGPRTALWLPGGPGSELPEGLAAWLQGQQVRPLVDAGFSVWIVTRRRHMPEGHTVADMAEDCARLIRDEFAGHIEVAVGVSYGGMISQYLAADHPETVGRVVVALSAVRITEWGRDVDERWARARVEQRNRDAGEAVAEYLFPPPGQQWQRRMLGPVLGLAFGPTELPESDLLVEANAERLFDATSVLPRIGVPTLIIHAAEDLFFDEDMIEQTAALIEDCQVITYQGKGHLRASVSSRIASDTVAFCEPSPSGGARG